MDQTYSPFEGSSELIRPAEILPPASSYQAEQAARLAYAERGSYGQMIHDMFLEVDRHPDQFAWPHETNLTDRIATRDTDAFQEVLSAVYDKLDNSDAVKAIRYQHKPIETAQDIEACYRAYERALDSALHRTDLTERQESKLKFAAHSELDWGLRDLVINHALESGAGSAEPRYEPKDFLLILDPKIRKVDYMDSREILAVLRRSGSMASRDRLQADLAVLRRTNREDAQAALQTFEGEDH